MYSANLNLIFHTHLPWVLHHGKWPHGEDWLAEAVAECYIPLFNNIEILINQAISPKISIDISPIVCEQLEHPDFKSFFVEYCNSKIKSAKEDEINFKAWNYDPHIIYLAQYWQNWFEERKNDFLYKYNSSIVNHFKKLNDQNHIELLTCGVTHGYLPLLGDDKSVNLQIEAAVHNFQKHFDKNPRGIWLPECAYRPAYYWKSFIPIGKFQYPKLRAGIEQFLSKFGIDHFVTDEVVLSSSEILGWFADDSNDYFLDKNNHHGELEHLDSLNLYNVISSKETSNQSAVVFTRNTKLAMQVWSGKFGYPAEPSYLDFHKKQEKSLLRYWSVTDTSADMQYKTLYHPNSVQSKIDLQTNHYIKTIEKTALDYNSMTGKKANICLPFDTELFGHWWFEGPEFIKSLLEGINNSKIVECKTTSETIEEIKPKTVIRLNEGSWGEENNHSVWINEENKWTWERIYNDEIRLEKIYNLFEKKDDKLIIDELSNRILKQIVKELILIQASDWQFIIHNQAARDYAEMRFTNHDSDFDKLCSLIEKHKNSKHTSQNNMTDEDLNYLSTVETRDFIFPELDVNWWNDRFNGI